ncbi:MAG: class I SAM-dependent methyltransferase [Phycisphaerae bacterium]|nr:class I SAM-dependent methyltransferase [Phycisphaerae bacterium]
MDSQNVEWALRLFSKSVLKRAKWREIAAALEGVRVETGLDLGSDNGVMSYLLRRRGGVWWSADLEAKAVEAIQSLVGDRVCRIDGHRLPMADASFDVVVVIDMLEHVQDDGGLVHEIHRVLRPGGLLIVNVPHFKHFSLLRRLRLALGLTDAWHGHVRAGYTVDGLGRLLEPEFEIGSHRTYNRSFSELLDIALNAAYLRKSASGPSEGVKGTIVTKDDLDKNKKLLRVYSVISPVMTLMSLLDVLVGFTSGYSLILRARKRARG